MVDSDERSFVREVEACLMVPQYPGCPQSKSARSVSALALVHRHPSTCVPTVVVFSAVPVQTSLYIQFSRYHACIASASRLQCLLVFVCYPAKRPQRVLGGHSGTETGCESPFALLSKSDAQALPSASMLKMIVLLWKHPAVALHTQSCEILPRNAFKQHMQVANRCENRQL